MFRVLGIYNFALRKEIQGHYLEVLRKNSTKRDNYYWVTRVTTNFGVLAKKKERKLFKVCWYTFALVCFKTMNLKTKTKLK